MAFQRDPVSEQFDQAAARLLRRADAARGQWRGTYVANPSAEWLAWGARNGVRLLGKDPQPGGLARTRWVRGFIRSVYYLHKNFYYEGKGLDLADRRVSPGGARSLQFSAGSVRIAPGGLVTGRLVRVRLLPSEGPFSAAVQRLPESARIYDDTGAPAGRWADPALRDWA
jgi:hypothetical protein